LKALPEEVEILHMDTFMTTLTEALKRGMVGEDLYPSRAAAADVSLIESGIRDEEAALKLLDKLAGICHLSEEEMSREINLGNWVNLAAKSPLQVENGWDNWRRSNEGFLPYDTTNTADGLGYNLFYSAWALVRARLNKEGIYANHMDRCLDDYLEHFSDPENSVLEEIWEMWRSWDDDPPALEKVKDMTLKLRELSRRT
ncbi:MAG: hypothetical protein HXS50_05325, partial [Theionarchaea archaeon]|nr:hypothetical protein [Theionarchaea archaeon]